MPKNSGGLKKLNRKNYTTQAGNQEGETHSETNVNAERL